MNTPNVVDIPIDAHVLKVGDGYLAFAVINSVRVAGGRRNTGYEALTSLFAVMFGASGDNSAVAIAIEMALGGVTNADLGKLLGEGK